MKLVNNVAVNWREEEGDGEGGAGGGRTVVVGVRLDKRSRELLTWALVKVAQSGDRVIALHVLHPSTFERGNRECRAATSLISLVKTFDSVLSVYEGFCNLKQVDLKLKVCRGSSVSQTIVNEAKFYEAATVVVGISSTRHTIRSNVSVAKYCARNLPKDFCILAVENGKVMFKKEASPGTHKDNRDQKNIVRLIHQSLSFNSRSSNDDAPFALGGKLKSGDCKKKSLSGNCLSCTSSTVLPDNHHTRVLAGPFEDESQCNSLAIVPTEMVQNDNSLQESPRGNSLENALDVCGRESCDNHSLSLMPSTPLHDGSCQNSPKSSHQKFRWTFLRGGLLFNHKHPRTRKFSVVKRVLRLPCRTSFALVYPDQRNNSHDQIEYLSGDTLAIVPVDSDASPSPQCDSVKSIPKELENFHERFSSTCRLFQYQELLSATSNFLPENLVGKGGSSQVYKGILPDGRELAIKVLKSSADAIQEFISEVEIITTLNHKNITSLFGFCFEDNNLVLVYDYLPRGSLEENLHGNKKDATAFGWDERYKVALGVAEALDYLHNECPKPVIHRDVKSSNILISSDFEPQLSDFGLAMWEFAASSNIMCDDIAGTFGYLAPEYFMHGKINHKTDVYAYGIVLLELLSGRKPINNEYPRGQENLVMWAKQILKDGKVSQLLDPSLGGNYDHDQIERLVLAARLCIRDAPLYRPEISQIVMLLQGDAEVIMWARQRVSASDELDSLDSQPLPNNIQAHLNLALLDLEDSSLSDGSIEHDVSIEDYLRGRWSRSSSFDEA
ncbi:Protein kinase domain [Dillenia turbinata]|uniref:Protein kinase domain n=1 Tax=Dillenia turbinata TaxID=194707 RepID=A0AAN8UUQ1_9MAGN